MNSDVVGSGILKLTTIASVPLIDEGPKAMLLPPRCDKNGNFYVRFFSGSNPQKSPINAFSQSGRHVATYALDGPPFEARGAGAVDFAVTRRSEVYILGVAEDGNYIVGFTPDGVRKSKVRLAIDFNALHFDVFDSGNFLVSGVERETDANLAPHSPYTAIFGSDGRLLKQIVFPEDKEYEEAAKRGDPGFFDSTLEGGGNFAVENGTVVHGSDGMMLVVRWTSPTKVYRVSEEGQVLSTFDVYPAVKSKKPSAVHEDSGKIAILYPAGQGDAHSSVMLINFNGEEVTSYDSREAGVALACFSIPEKFTFFTANAKVLQLATMVGK